MENNKTSHSNFAIFITIILLIYTIFNFKIALAQDHDYLIHQQNLWRIEEEHRRIQEDNRRIHEQIIENGRRSSDNFLHQQNEFSSIQQRDLQLSKLKERINEQQAFIKKQKEWMNLKDELEITIVRYYRNEKGTSGYFFIGDKPIGYTIERPWKDNKKGVSSIPPGSYKGVLRYDVKGKGEKGPSGWRIELKDVPDRTAIQVHPGNVPVDSQGCILPGTELKKGNLLEIKPGESGKAMKKLREAFYDSNDPVFTPDKDIWITVIDKTSIKVNGSDTAGNTIYENKQFTKKDTDHTIHKHHLLMMHEQRIDNFKHLVSHQHHNDMNQRRWENNLLNNHSWMNQMSQQRQIHEQKVFSNIQIRHQTNLQDRHSSSRENYAMGGQERGRAPDPKPQPPKNYDYTITHGDGFIVYGTVKK